MALSGRSETRKERRIRRETLRVFVYSAVVPFVVEDGQQSPGEPPLKNRVRFKIPFFGEGEAEGPYGIIGLIAALTILGIITVLVGRI
jgi:hypothetical protein